MTAVVVVGLFMALLDTTIVSVTLPQMQKAFQADFSGLLLSMVSFSVLIDGITEAGSKG